jgi:hypothetical protein
MYMSQIVDLIMTFYSPVFEIGFYYVVQVGLELLILLPQSPKFWDYRYVPHHAYLTRAILGLFFFF